MRRLIFEVPSGQGETVRKAACDVGGVNVAVLSASGDARDLVIAHVGNSVIDRLIEKLADVPDLRLSFDPRGVLALYPPEDEAPDQVTDVSRRSALEIYLSGLQSVGSWNGFLGYAAAAGVVVWIGLFTNTVFLLTAAMLIAPYAGPAMNAALATARGDASLFGRAVVRYFAGLALTIVIAWALTMLFRQQIATSQMVETSLISSSAVLLPLVAGAAGALNLCQSDRTSLVSGAATGMLVAASLAPQAGLIGMASAIGEWAMVRSATFVLMLQLAGINLSGAIVFWLFKIRPDGVRFSTGKTWFPGVAGGATLAALAALVAVQFRDLPDLQQSTRAQRMNAEIQQVVTDSGLARFVEAETRFTRSGIPDQHTLIAEVFVQIEPGQAAAEVEQTLTASVSSTLKQAYSVTPLVSVTALAAPDG